MGRFSFLALACVLVLTSVSQAQRLRVFRSQLVTPFVPTVTVASPFVAATVGTSVVGVPAVSAVAPLGVGAVQAVNTLSAVDDFAALPAIVDTVAVRRGFRGGIVRRGVRRAAGLGYRGGVRRGAPLRNRGVLRGR